MLSVQVKLWPRGDIRRERELATLEIWNVCRDEGNTYKYGYVIKLDEKLIGKGEVFHNRNDNVWELVALVLENEKERLTKYEF
jgi:hypothetical protein